MSRPPPKIQNLEAEPRRHGGGGAPGGGPPPAYHRPESETGSDYSSVSQMGKRRASWSNLVESDENLTAVRVNQYPNVVKSGSSLIGSIATSTAPVSQIHSGHPLHPQSQSQPQSQPQSNPHHRPPSQLTHFSSHMFVVPKGTLVDAAPASSSDRSRAVHHAGSSAAPSVANSDAILADAKKKKRNRLQEILNWCSNPRQGLCALCLLLVLIVGIIAAIVIPLALRAPKKVSLAFQAPEALRGGSSASTTIQMNSDGDQVRFMIRGSPPLKGNFLSVYDFKTNFIGVVDESLKNNGRQLFCFILRLDRGNIPDEVDLRKAAQETRTKSQQTQGWQETWSYQPQPLIMQNQSQYFSQPIDECNGARWMQLEMASTNQRTQQCTDCQGFCLPELGIEKDTVRDESYLNVVRLDCFQLFVPEWRQFAQANSFEQNQRDFEQYYRVSNGGNRIGNGNGNGQAGKWINVNNGYAQNAINGGVMMPSGQLANGQLANGQLNPNNQQQQQPGQTAQGNNLQNLQAAVFAGSLPQNNQQLQQQQELQQYMKERNPGLINGQLGPIGPTTAVVHPGAPSIVHNQQWHQGDAQQQWLNTQSASNPAMPPIGWSGMANGNGRNNNNNDGRWTGNEAPVGIGGTLNRAIQPVLQGAQSGIQSAANTIQQGAQSVGEAVQSGLQQVQGGIQNLQGNVQDAGKSAQQIIQEARQRLQQQSANGVNGVNPPSGYFQQMNPRQGGYPGYDNAYLNGNQINQQQSGTNLVNPQNYNVQPF
ncbi:unnamed protein product, partial [Mesorhabditis belari]|uniref:BRICHOS domain-containing protein n=1 Tax=Mesorhabditis belari TaxID=2138241 RepID=A0AAF3FQW2_9BILA